MILEQVGIPDIAAESLDGPMAAHVHHLEDRRAIASGRREEARAQGVGRIGAGVEPGAASISLDDIGNGPTGKPAVPDRTGLVDRAE